MIDLCFSQWQTHRWVNVHTQRYYEARVLKNLLDEWEVFIVWGGLGARLGGTQVLPAARYEDALNTLTEIHHQRLKRRYAPVAS